LTIGFGFWQLAFITKKKTVSMGLTLERRLFGNSAIWLFSLLFSCLATNPASALNPGAVSITNKSGVTFNLNSSSPGTGPRGAYVAFEVCNTSGSALANLTATISGFTSEFELQGTQAAAQNIPSLSAGGCTTLFWYIVYTSANGKTMNLKITVSDASPGTVVSQTAITTRRNSSSGANGQLVGFTVGPGILQGSSTYVDIQYSLATVANGGVVLFQPAGNTDFDAGCIKLTGTEIVATEVPTIAPLGSTNTLQYTSPGTVFNGTKKVTVRYSFAVACSNTNTKLNPYITSTTSAQLRNSANYGSSAHQVDVPADFPVVDACATGTPDDFAVQMVGSGIGLEGGGDDWGAAWGDYDGDGLQDLFVASHDPAQPNALYHNNGNGKFTKLNSAPFSTDLAESSAASWGDYDNDGDLDLYVANNIGFENFLYRNEGGGSFTKIQGDPIVSSKGYSHGVSWVDYDNDGFLDMFVAVYWETAFNLLYHNNGDGTFTEVVGNAITNEAKRSVAGVWADYDNDGLMDLFVANTGGQNNSLYHNAGGGNFQRVSSGAIVSDGGSSVGASWGDYNNDGFLDLFVTNAGSEPCFLYKNNGDGSFTRIMAGSPVTDLGNAHGSAWADYDNDGDLDLFVARDGQDNSLYRNDGNGVFTSVHNAMTAGGGLSFGSAWADYDNDGDLDLFVANRLGTGDFLYNNTKGNCQKWLKIKLVGTNANKSAIGARVTATAVVNGQTLTQTRMVTGQTGGGIGGQNSLVVSFGFGSAATVSSIVVHWPSGYTQTLTNQATGQFITITEDNTSEVSGFIYYKKDLVCGTPSQTLPAGAQGAIYRTVKSGNWTTASTWLNGNIPPTDYIFNKTISIEHDVTLSSGSIYMTGTSTIWMTNAKLTMQSGNLTMDNGALKMLGSQLDLVNGSIDLLHPSTRFEVLNSSVNMKGNFNSGGKTIMRNADFAANGDHNNNGIDSLQNVRMTVGNNFQNNLAGIMVVDNARIHVTNGIFQNISPAQIKGTGLVAWVESGNIVNVPNLANNNWTVTVSQYCTPNWATPTGISATYLPAAKDCATIAPLFATDPSVLPPDLTGLVGMPYVKVVFQPGNTTVYTDANGYYSAFLPAGSYTAQEFPGSNYIPKCPNSAGIIPVVVAGPGLSYPNYDFGNDIIESLPDLATEVVTTAHRIGGNGLMLVNYRNIGTATALNVALELSIPAEMSILVSSMPYAVNKSGNTTLVFALGDVAPNQGGTIYLHYTIDPATSIGTNLTVTATIDNGDIEISKANNVSTDQSQAVGAIDPNDISVSPGRYVKRGEWLYYKIRFQNVGNIPASQIRVTDKLPEGLDLSTLEMGSVSHIYRLQADGHNLTWTFPNINLPDSLSDEAASHGYLSFRIKPSDGLAVGERLLNQAAIYFDNLQPVLTNTVENILVAEPVKETQAKARPLQVFPNPSSGHLTVQSLELPDEPSLFFAEMKVFDQFGRQVYEVKNIANQRQELNLHQLGTGTYLVKALDSKGRAYYGKVVLMRD
jgi:uncharacterized repeat protein (TIGR01451 family)